MIDIKLVTTVSLGEEQRKGQKISITRCTTTSYRYWRVLRSEKALGVEWKILLRKMGNSHNDLKIIRSMGIPGSS